MQAVAKTVRSHWEDIDLFLKSNNRNSDLVVRRVELARQTVVLWSLPALNDTQNIGVEAARPAVEMYQLRYDAAP